MMASILGLEGEERMSDKDVDRLLDGCVDPAGTFYRYGLPASLLRRKRMK
jgi:F420-non-reducing hydrogenase small subunit